MKFGSERTTLVVTTFGVRATFFGVFFWGVFFWGVLRGVLRGVVKGDFDGLWRFFGVTGNLNLSLILIYNEM